MGGGRAAASVALACHRFLPSKLQWRGGGNTSRLGLGCIFAKPFVYAPVHLNPVQKQCDLFSSLNKVSQLVESAGRRAPAALLVSSCFLQHIEVEYWPRGQGAVQHRGRTWQRGTYAWTPLLTFMHTLWTKKLSEHWTVHARIVSSTVNWIPKFNWTWWSDINVKLLVWKIVDLILQSHGQMDDFEMLSWIWICMQG